MNKGKEDNINMALEKCGISERCENRFAMFGTQFESRNLRDIPYTMSLGVKTEMIYFDKRRAQFYLRFPAAGEWH